MINQMTSLTMSMHANPGVYALLLGSGISRSAQIPTGWDIVTALARRIAAAEGMDCGDDPCDWYEKTHGRSPSYSEMLEAIGKTQAERSQLLRSYFEPTDEELAEGIKRPTPAHRAIAKLVKRGSIRVILTTNFDQLMEQALTEVGVSPTIVATPGALKGAQPLVHSKCTVIKLHGDYMDLETKNTPVELEAYSPEINDKLDSILEDFGLIICGWSADWDAALCEALRRRKSRRYTFWWTGRRGLTGKALSLCEFCQAEEVRIENADSFFESLNEKVEALENIDANHPISAKIAVSLTKKYLSEMKYKIRLNDLVMEEVENIIQETSPDKLPLKGAFTDPDYVERIQRLDSCSEVALKIVATGCFWDRDGKHIDIWTKAISRLAIHRFEDGGSTWMRFLSKEPARLILYAAGIAFAANEKWDCIYKLLSQPRVHSPYRSDTSLAHFYQDDTFSPDVYKKLPEFGLRKTPISDHMFETLRTIFLELLPVENEYTDAFDTFEILQSFWFVDAKENSIDGRFMWKDRHPILARITEDVQSNKGQSMVFQAGFFGGELSRYENSLDIVERYVRRNQW